ncbi:hypothetical protein AB0395_20495 [Streptosporangium sp. NPDC051023]|uniref:hypothetical protein n=1 Tax=Streptosporangium sp. NPDC051023 TaxID=3155410 RepID=UPI00344D5254
MTAGYPSGIRTSLDVFACAFGLRNAMDGGDLGFFLNIAEQAVARFRNIPSTRTRDG